VKGKIPRKLTSLEYMMIYRELGTIFSGPDGDGIDGSIPMAMLDDRWW
jgi:hypothetical protein